MIKVFNSIAKDSVIKKDIIKFFKKIDVFNNNNFFYLIKFKLLKHKLFIITII